MSRGFFSQGVLVSLKDTPIEDVKPDSEELRFLSNLKPASSFAGGQENGLMFEDGILDNGNSYASHVKVIENTTYGLRIIGYRVPYKALLGIGHLLTIHEVRSAYIDGIPRADLNARYFGGYPAR